MKNLDAQLTGMGNTCMGIQTMSSKRTRRPSQSQMTRLVVVGFWTQDCGAHADLGPEPAFRYYYYYYYHYHRVIRIIIIIIRIIIIVLIIIININMTIIMIMISYY